jgi:hypothetical protein
MQNSEIQIPAAFIQNDQTQPAIPRPATTSPRLLSDEEIQAIAGGMGCGLIGALNH